jgi:hypothetical protein
LSQPIKPVLPALIIRTICTHPELENSMATSSRNPIDCPHRWSRRDALRVGGLTALGLGLPDLLRLRRLSAAPVAEDKSARRCVVVWLDGGPSHLETFDPKPEAPQEVRGPLESISTAVSGITLTECLPGVATRMQQVAVIRSMTSPLGEHNFGTHYLMTGYKPTPVLEYPAFSSVAAHLRPQMGALPAHIAVPTFRVGGAGLTGGAFLPAAAHPFPVGGDPAKPEFRVNDLSPFQGISVDRLDRRREFLSRLDGFRESAESTSLPTLDPEFDQAFELTTSKAAREAFQLDDEPAAVRNRYGRRTIGQSCLLARRLLERDVPIVTVNQRGWDTHENLYTRLKEGYTGAKVPVGLIPTLDQGVCALMDDLEERGLLEETLIVVMGEFGRTPKLNTRGGRDHWPRVFSVMLAGGGVRGGQVIGSSDSVGESPADSPVTPSDLAATIYTLLGIDPTLELKTPDNRPVRLTPHGSRVVNELVSA